MKPDQPLRQVAGVFKQTGALPRGRGKVSGVIAFSLAVLCFLGLLAFHFPEYLTTPELRKNYSVDMLRQVMLVAMLIAGGIAAANLIRRRNRPPASKPPSVRMRRSPQAIRCL